MTVIELFNEYSAEVGLGSTLWSITPTDHHYRSNLIISMRKGYISKGSLHRIDEQVINTVVVKTPTFKDFSGVCSDSLLCTTNSMCLIVNTKTDKLFLPSADGLTTLQMQKLCYELNMLIESSKGKV